MSTIQGSTPKKINYSNRKKLNASFVNNDLKRSNCFGSDFTGSTFDNVSFKGAQFKNCKFIDCTFKNAEFIATNLKNSKFTNAHFEDVIIDSAKLQGVSFEHVTFKNVIIVNSNTQEALDLNITEGVRLFDLHPVLDISSRLERAIRASKKNEFIKKAGVLDTKDGKVNPMAAMILLEKFSEEELITGFAKLKADVDQDFATLKFIIDTFNSYK